VLEDLDGKDVPACDAGVAAPVSRAFGFGDIPGGRIRATTTRFGLCLQPLRSNGKMRFKPVSEAPKRLVL
jgi:hypothetical protein